MDIDQQKDFLALFHSDHATNNNSANPSSSQNHMSYPNFTPTNNSGNNNNPMLANLMQMQALETQAAMLPSSSYNPQLLLEQQFKLSQLQQLHNIQNQIFQQTMAIISGQSPPIIPSSPSADSHRDSSFTGLPTPGAPLAKAQSSELRPQSSSMDFISPIVLNNGYMDHQNSYRNPEEHFSSPMLEQPMSSLYDPGRSAVSAPEHVAFNRTNHDLDLDISPLTSPWLGAHQPASHYLHNNNSNNNNNNNNHAVGTKRTASSSGDEAPSRKKQHSPAIRPTHPSYRMPLSHRASRSTNSTPLLRSTRARGGSIIGEEAVGDTPSPVDLSMPPPAPPSQAHASSSGHNNDSHTQPQPAGQSSPAFGAQPSPAYSGHSSPAFGPRTTPLTPVTPASIMNLGRLGINSSLAPPPAATSPTAPTPTDSRGRTRAGSKTGAGKKSSNSLVSPSLKAILPAGPTTQAADNSPAHSGPVVQVRKTSHKAAEQKRRDSLKTTFDDLRGLLPPIPLPTDERHPDEPVLPGALPPRGPPKAGGEGPNKGVSKLQLLICGNEYIRTLRGRVERRDEEISRLRREIGRLRMMAGEVHMEEDVDLERDLDAIEALRPSVVNVGGDDGDEEGDD